MSSQQINDLYQKRSDYAEIMYQRAIGVLPEMESSKAVAQLLAPEVQRGDSILDVGCGAGHYFRSLEQIIEVPFEYTGVDAANIFIDVAQRAWSDEPRCTFRVEDIYNLSFPDRTFDIVICNNMLYNLPSIIRPIQELLRVARRMVLIRTPIGDRSFRIQEVYSQANWPLSDIPVTEEFRDDGEPTSFVYHNIYSQGYVEAVIQRLHPNAATTFIEDNYFDGDSINRGATATIMVNATQVVNGMQISGNYIVQPWCFVQIRLAE